jgi:hypothetical protein
MIRWFLLIPVLAWADDPAPPVPPPPPKPHDVKVELSGGVTVNWTNLTLEITASASGGGVGGDRRTVEQNARFDAGPRLMGAMESLDVDGMRHFSDLEADAKLSSAMRARKDHWAVAETRYFASGKVEIDAVASVQELLKPYSLSRARQAPDWLAAGIDESKVPTGLLVDARGLSISPVFAPSIVDPSGTILFDGALWQADAAMRAPVTWVSGADHPAVPRTVGDRALSVKAIEARPGTLVVAAADADRIRAEILDQRPIGSGAVVVVLDP